MQQGEMLEIDISKLSSLKQFASFFKKGKVEQLARESGFISRSTSRLSDEMFLKMLCTHIAPVLVSVTTYRNSSA